MTEVIAPGAPPIRGLRFRTVRDDDVPAMVRVINAACRANANPEFRTEALLRSEMAHPSSTDPYADDLLAFVGDELAAVALLRFEDSNEGPRQYQTHCFVAPDWRRRGLGRAIFARNEARLRQIAGRHELLVEPVYTTWVDEPDVGARVLMEGGGYRMVRIYHHMLRPDMLDIELPPVAEGIDIRPATRQDLSAVWDAMSEAFKDHFGGMDISPAAFRRWSNSPRMDPDLVLVAFDGDEVAAAVQGAIVAEENDANDYLRGWADPVFTRRAWRRRGLAAAVLGRTLARLRDRGMTSAQLSVDTKNPNDALSLYRRHRFESVHVETEWHKPMLLER